LQSLTNHLPLRLFTHFKLQTEAGAAKLVHLRGGARDGIHLAPGHRHLPATRGQLAGQCLAKACSGARNEHALVGESIFQPGHGLSVD